MVKPFSYLFPMLFAVVLLPSTLEAQESEVNGGKEDSLLVEERVYYTEFFLSSSTFSQSIRLQTNYGGPIIFRLRNTEGTLIRETTYLPKNGQLKIGYGELSKTPGRYILQIEADNYDNSTLIIIK